MQRLFEAFEQAGKELFLVGGAVRDRALGVGYEALDDLDFCTDARPKETLAILKEHHFTTYEVGIEFGTVGTVLRGPASEGYPKDVQITTYRSTEYYRRGSRHPEVQFGDTIDDDLGRRDFSINSIALRADLSYYDPHGGLDDIENKVLRVVGDPLETLAEDPLRILRIGRFMSRLNFVPDAPLREAAASRAEYILDISRERWLQEMTKLLKGAHVAVALEFLHDIGVLGIILPELAILRTSEEPSSWHDTLAVVAEVDYTQAPLRWAALLREIGSLWSRDVLDEEMGLSRRGQQAAMLFEGIARRFTFDNATADTVSFLLRHQGWLSRQASLELGDASIRRLVRRLDPRVAEAIELRRAELAVEREREAAQRELESLVRIERRIKELEDEGALRPSLPTGIGTALMRELKMSRGGPIIGEIKDFLEDEIIEGRLESNREASDYVAYLREHVPQDLREALGPAWLERR